MEDDPLDKLAASIKASRPTKKVSKATRTLRLAEPNFTVLQTYCKTKGKFVGDVMDDLINVFLEKVKDDLPK